MDKSFSLFLNYAACSVLVIAFVCLIIGACSFFLSSDPVQQHQVVLTVNPDSTFDKEKFSYYTDSLIQVINKHEHVIEDRYNAILEEKYDTQRYWSIAGIVASIVIALFGVFGYKSFKDIEAKCESLTKTETARILNEQLQGLVHTEMAQSQYSTTIENRIIDNIRNSEIRDIEERIQNLEHSDDGSENPQNNEEEEDDPEIPDLPTNNQEEDEA